MYEIRVREGDHGLVEVIDTHWTKPEADEWARKFRKAFGSAFRVRVVEAEI